MMPPTKKRSSATCAAADGRGGVAVVREADERDQQDQRQREREDPGARVAPDGEHVVADLVGEQGHAVSSK